MCLAADESSEMEVALVPNIIVIRSRSYGAWSSLEKLELLFYYIHDIIRRFDHILWSVGDRYWINDLDSFVILRETDSHDALSVQVKIYFAMP